MTNNELLYETKPTTSPVPALDKIAVLMRHVDDQLAAMRQDVSPVRRLSAVENVPDLDEVLGPFEHALETAAACLKLEPKVLDGRRALRGPLHIIWADLIDMSPDNLRKHWGVHDVPEVWADLHGLLLAAVERAIAQLDQPQPPGPEPAREPL